MPIFVNFLTVINFPLFHRILPTVFNIVSFSVNKISTFLGPRGPLGLPSSVRPSDRPPVCKKNLDQLYSSINHHRTTANLSDIVWCISGNVWWCLEYVWCCLVASDACLVVFGGVNVYRLIWPELIDVYGQISLPVHLTDAAKMLMLLMH